MNVEQRLFNRVNQLFRSTHYGKRKGYYQQHIEKYLREYYNLGMIDSYKLPYWCDNFVTIVIYNVDASVGIIEVPLDKFKNNEKDKTDAYDRAMRGI